MAFNIEWESIRYEEMNVPLYSGLAFQIYLVSINAYPIGWGVDAQAELYAEITSQATIQWQTYMARFVQIQNKLCQNQETDLVFLVDESGSIGQDNFSIMRSFVSNVIGRLNIGETNTRVSLRRVFITVKLDQGLFTWYMVKPDEFRISGRVLELSQGVEMYFWY